MAMTRHRETEIGNDEAHDRKFELGSRPSQCPTKRSPISGGFAAAFLCYFRSTPQRVLEWLANLRPNDDGLKLEDAGTSGGVTS
jgi:hypothetical protein